MEEYIDPSNIPKNIYLDRTYYYESDDNVDISRLEIGRMFPLYPHKPKRELLHYLTENDCEYTYIHKGDIYCGYSPYPLDRADIYECTIVYIHPETYYDYARFSLLYDEDHIGEYVVQLDNCTPTAIFPDDHIPQIMYGYSMRVSLFDPEKGQKRPSKSSFLDVDIHSN